MKKTVLMLAIASAFVVSTTSCKKERIQKPAITQTITAQLKTNESYTFVLPKNLRDDAYEITQLAQHASVSLVGENLNGDQIYSYTPALNYVGTDQVVVSNDEEREEMQHPKPHKPGPPKGNCENEGQEEEHYIITINFSVEGVKNSALK